MSETARRDRRCALNCDLMTSVIDKGPSSWSWPFADYPKLKVLGPSKHNRIFECLDHYSVISFNPIVRGFPDALPFCISTSLPMVVPMPRCPGDRDAVVRIILAHLACQCAGKSVENLQGNLYRRPYCDRFHHEVVPNESWTQFHRPSTYLSINYLVHDMSTRPCESASDSVSA